MKRLIEGAGKNNAAEYDAIYVKRFGKVSRADYDRWRRLLKHFHGGSLIDLGCLDSQIPSLIDDFLQDGAGAYYGLDQATEAIKTLSKGNILPRTYYCVGDINKTNFLPSQFDYVVMGEVLEHLEEPKKAILEAIRILKSGGVLAISTPLEEGKEPGACDAERHLWSFSTEDIHDMLTPHGQVEVETMRSRFTPWPPFYEYRFPVIVAFCFKT